jgi:hypothetical protein
MKKIPVHLPSAEGNPIVGEASLYEDGIILVELNLEGEGNELRKLIVGDSIDGLSIQGDEDDILHRRPDVAEELSFPKINKDTLISDHISVVDLVEEAYRKANRHGL